LSESEETAEKQETQEKQETVEKQETQAEETASEITEARPETAVSSEADALRAELEIQEKAVKAAQDQYLRALAEHENYKKRTQKDRAEQIKFANENLIKETLPVIDNLERAISHSNETRDFEKMVEGVVMIKKQLLAVLNKFGVRPIESLNQPFDPYQHQSVGQVEVEADVEIEDGHVAEEAQKGYFLNDRVLRPSFVLLAKKKQASTET